MHRIAAHPLVTVFVLALAVRLINLALLSSDDAFFAENDTSLYWLIGAKMAAPGGVAATLLEVTDRTPLYPLLLGAMRSVFGDTPRLVAFVQAVIDAGTCTLIAALGAFVSPRVGLIAGIIAALSVTLIVFSTQILTETLFLFFFTSMLLIGAHYLRSPTLGLALLAGVASGLALATRTAVAPMLAAAVPLVFVVAMARQRGFATALAATALFAMATVAPITPLLARNVLHYGHFSLTSQTGDHLAFWIVPLVTQRADGTPYQVTVDRLKERDQQALAARGLPPDTNPFVRSAVKAEIAREEMARLPPAAYAKAWLEGIAVNLGAPALLADPRVRALPKPSFYNTPGASLREKARAYVLDDPGRYQLLLVIGLLATLPFLVLEAVGFIMLARTQPWAAVFAGSLLAYFLLLNGPVATAKYRVPMEPVLIVLAAIPLARLVERRAA
jgi:4-amino-4-deoxy-L-arabinose transferase-like glycosyltransferase